MIHTGTQNRVNQHQYRYCCRNDHPFMTAICSRLASTNGILATLQNIVIHCTNSGVYVYASHEYPSFASFTLSFFRVRLRITEILFSVRPYRPAIEATGCFTIADHILDNAEDSEECVNDTWLHAWNAMPPQRPNVLRMFLAKSFAKAIRFDVLGSEIPPSHFDTACRLTPKYSATNSCVILLLADRPIANL